MAISCAYCGGEHDRPAEVRACWTEHGEQDAQQNGGEGSKHRAFSSRTGVGAVVDSSKTGRGGRVIQPGYVAAQRETSRSLGGRGRAEPDQPALFESGG